MFNYVPTIQSIDLSYNHQVDVLRLDLIHEIVSGNKWFKLKNNIAQAKQQNYKRILTFGGAHSNHLAATAKACYDLGLDCIAVIRGEHFNELSETLQMVQSMDMQLHFVSREEYNLKTTTPFVDQLKSTFGDFYLVPEGGNNNEGIMGCMGILNKNWQYDYVFCACGTGATFAGLVASAKANQIVVGISVLKGENKLPLETETNLNTLFSPKKFEINGNEELNKPTINTHCIINEYAFSGYAKYDKNLIDFKKAFEAKHAIQLDYVYTNKLFFAIEDLCKKQKLKPNAKILVIHSGGLQGNKAFEKRYMS